LIHVLRNPQVSITLAQSAGQQQIAGEHIIAQDGRVNLGIYGSVYVAGMTVDEVRRAVEQHLSQFLDNPKVAVDVGAYNSKVYYVIFGSAGFGESVLRFPAMGNETVLDALSQTNGLSQLASKHAIWIARPSPSGAGCDQILPVHWDEITKEANTSTNYQVFPGDRIFIDSDKFYAADSALTKVIAPFERIFGVTTLGIQTLFRLEHPQSTFGGNNLTSRW
jgi:protein involved in polysaccharide export with SLBB domain